MKRAHVRLRQFVRWLLPSPDHKETQMRSNPIRAAILKLLEDSPEPPGTTAEEVRAELQADAPLSAVAYHLRVLADNDYLRRDDSETDPLPCRVCVVAPARFQQLPQAAKAS